MRDVELRREVTEELEWDPGVDASRIEVSVHDGVVTLGGRVESYAQRRRAEEVVRRVRGARGVASDLEVHLPAGAERSDEELAATVSEALRWHALVPRERIRPRVNKGWVTMEGEVDWEFQKEAATAAVSNLLGVRGVIDEIRVKPRGAAAGSGAGIEAALRRHAALEGARLSVEVSGGRVILRGEVRTWVERDDAVQAAWNAPGVSAVEDHLTIRG